MSPQSSERQLVGCKPRSRNPDLSHAKAQLMISVLFQRQLVTAFKMGTLQRAVLSLSLVLKSLPNGNSTIGCSLMFFPTLVLLLWDSYVPSELFPWQGHWLFLGAWSKHLIRPSSSKDLILTAFTSGSPMLISAGLLCDSGLSGPSSRKMWIQVQMLQDLQHYSSVILRQPYQTKPTVIGPPGVHQ